MTSTVESTFVYTGGDSMCSKLFRWGLSVVVLVWVLGMFFLDGELFSYVRTSAKSVKTAVQDQIPLELELERQSSPT